MDEHKPNNISKTAVIGDYDEYKTETNLILRLNSARLGNAKEKLEEKGFY